MQKLREWIGMFRVWVFLSVILINHCVLALQSSEENIYKAFLKGASLKKRDLPQSLPKAESGTDRLLSDVKDVLEKADAGTLYHLFHEPDYRRWNQLYQKAFQKQATVMDIVCWLDATKNLVFTLLNQNDFGSDDALSYMPALFDKALLKIYTGCWGISNKPVDESVRKKMLSILETTRESLNVYSGFMGTALNPQQFVPAKYQNDATFQNHFKVIQQVMTGSNPTSLPLKAQVSLIPGWIVNQPYQVTKIHLVLNHQLKPLMEAQNNSLIKESYEAGFQQFSKKILEQVLDILSTLPQPDKQTALELMTVLLKESGEEHYKEFLKLLNQKLENFEPNSSDFKSEQIKDFIRVIMDFKSETDINSRTLLQFELLDKISAWPDSPQNLLIQAILDLYKNEKLTTQTTLEKIIDKLSRWIHEGKLTPDQAKSIVNATGGKKIGADRWIALWQRLPETLKDDIDFRIRSHTLNLGIDELGSYWDKWKDQKVKLAWYLKQLGFQLTKSGLEKAGVRDYEEVETRIKQFQREARDLAAQDLNGNAHNSETVQSVQKAINLLIKEPLPPEWQIDIKDREKTSHSKPGEAYTSAESQQEQAREDRVKQKFNLIEQQIRRDVIDPEKDQESKRIYEQVLQQLKNIAPDAYGHPPVSNYEILAHIWHRIVTSPKKEKNEMVDLLKLQMILTVENGKVVCNTGTIERLIQTLQPYLKGVIIKPSPKMLAENFIEAHYTFWHQQDPSKIEKELRANLTSQKKEELEKRLEKIKKIKEIEGITNKLSPTDPEKRKLEAFKEELRKLAKQQYGGTKDKDDQQTLTDINVYINALE